MTTEGEQQEAVCGTLPSDETWAGTGACILAPDHHGTHYNGSYEWRRIPAPVVHGGLTGGLAGVVGVAGCSICGHAQSEHEGSTVETPRCAACLRAFSGDWMHRYASPTPSQDASVCDHLREWCGRCGEGIYRRSPSEPWAHANRGDVPEHAIESVEDMPELPTAWMRGQSPSQDAEGDLVLGAALAELAEAEEWADRLAYAIAPVSVIGEHSSANNPWMNALEIVGQRESAIRAPYEDRLTLAREALAAASAVMAVSGEVIGASEGDIPDGLWLRFLAAQRWSNEAIDAFNATESLGGRKDG